MKHQILNIFIALCLSIIVPLQTLAGTQTKKIQVVTSSQDLASIIENIGKDKVNVISMGKGNQNPHFVPPKPSFMLKLKDAQMLVEVGMDLEVWLDPLVEGSRNQRIKKGSTGYVNASTGIPILGTPATKPDRSQGDVHPYGNPHYWLDPVNAKYISANITQGLKRIDPLHAEDYERNKQLFLKQLAHKITEWMIKAKPLQGIKVFTYHKSWAYFAKRFGINVIDTIEPKPGIPPTAKHTRELIEKAKTQQVRLILIEPYYNRAVPDQIAKATGIKVVIIPPSVGGTPDARDYFSLFDTILNILLRAAAT